MPDSQPPEEWLRKSEQSISLYDNALGALNDKCSDSSRRVNLAGEEDRSWVFRAAKQIGTKIA